MRFFVLFFTLSTALSSNGLQLFSWDGKAIGRVRQALKVNLKQPIGLSASLLQLWRESKKDIYNLNKKGYPSVHDKNITAAGYLEDKSYYYSVVPYAYPCNELPEKCIDYEGQEFSGNCTRDGLPWVICDGKINRKSAVLTDRIRLEDMMHMVMRLSLSGYVFDDLERSAQASRVLRKWFINMNTRMRPSLRFGQGIPGRYEGKASACMDMYFSGRGFIDAIQLLQKTPGIEKHWTWEDQKGMKEWASKFSRYMYESSEVRKESTMKNNHGVYYDVTLLAWATLGHETEIIQHVNGTSNCNDYRFCIRGRIDYQVDSEGILKYEMHRADPGHYLWYTLLANIYLANIADRLGNKDGFNSRYLSLAADWAILHLLSDENSRIRGRNDYSVHAYRIFARGTGKSKYEAAACLSLIAQIQDHGNYFWSSHKVGIHVLNIVMPPIHQDLDNSCEAWMNTKHLHDDKQFKKYWMRMERQKRLSLLGKLSNQYVVLIVISIIAIVVFYFRSKQVKFLSKNR